MASSSVIAILANLLALQLWPATGNIRSPQLSSLFDDVCKEVECGKGTCKSSQNSTFLFECQCDPGWKQTLSHHDNGLKFLPCVIPNCTLNYACTEGAPPAQDKEVQANKSFFDPCHWASCGGGICNKTSPFTHKCECRVGYYNLLNTSTFPCFSQCAIGMDCSGLGIATTNTTTSPTASLGDNGPNRGISVGRGNGIWLISVAMALAFHFWK
ncbi:uncharacterized protein LOC127800060 [Diospyros lotus]|uniref:uncharacterized protein LOC127800060 n=1 Tax=Diospyros lotus TaxID=55363 RepID=UPI002255BFC7|nr:uncharacterized protein LOC127800060 [Diospyros lotus]